MTFMELVGCGGIAFGPALALFLLTVMQDPIRIIILTVSAFFWLVSLLVSAVLWNLIPSESATPISVVFSVLFQEGFRFLLYVILKKAENGMKKITMPGTNKEMFENLVTLSYVSGLGFGVMSCAFAIINVLAAVAGPATIGLNGESAYFALISSVFAMCLTLLHTFWSVIFFNGVDKRNYIEIVWVVGTHLMVSCMTFLNERSLYVATFIPPFAVVFVSACMCLAICRKSRHVCAQAETAT